MTPQPAPRDEKAWYCASSREAVVTAQAEGPHAPLCTLRVLRPRAQLIAMQWTPHFWLCAKGGGGLEVRERRQTCGRYHFGLPGLSQKQVTVTLSSILLCFLNFPPNRDTVCVLREDCGHPRSSDLARPWDIYYHFLCPSTLLHSKARADWLLPRVHSVWPKYHSRREKKVV